MRKNKCLAHSSECNLEKDEVTNFTWLGQETRTNNMLKSATRGIKEKNRTLITLMIMIY